MRKLKWTRHEDLAIRRGGETLGRKEYLDWMSFKGGRVPFTELFGPLIGLKEAWEEQGASPDELDFSRFKYRIPPLWSVPVSASRLGARMETLLEDERKILYKDDLGRTLELCKGSATIPLPRDYPVSSMDEWLKLKHKYQYSQERFAADWKVQARKAVAQDKALAVSMPGGFDEARQLLGEEAVCYACHDQPELLMDINSTIAETAFRVMEEVGKEFRIDVLFVHEDMAGKSGPLWGPKEIESFIKPGFRKVWDMLEERGATIFDMDSDGNLNPIIGALLDCGVNCLRPLEPAAGMDIVKTREKHGQSLRLVGGIDKYALTGSLADIDRELERKLPSMIKTQGCVIGLDHRIPAEVSLKNYRYYIKKAWEIIGAMEASA